MRAASSTLIKTGVVVVALGAFFAVPSLIRNSMTKEVGDGGYEITIGVLLMLVGSVPLVVGVVLLMIEECRWHLFPNRSVPLDFSAPGPVQRPQ